MMLKALTIEMNTPMSGTVFAKKAAAQKTVLSAPKIDCVSGVGRRQSSSLPLDYERLPTLLQQMP